MMASTDAFDFFVGTISVAFLSDLMDVSGVVHICSSHSRVPSTLTLLTSTTRHE